MLKKQITKTVHKEKEVNIIILNVDINRLINERRIQKNKNIKSQIVNNNIVNILDKENFKVKSLFTGISFVNKDGIQYPERTNYMCWHDRHGFDEIPIGVPIQYEIIKNEDDENKVEENKNDNEIFKKRKGDIKGLKLIKKNINKEKINYCYNFYMEGIFCSYDCCFAYLIEENKKNDELYKDSFQLLNFLFGLQYPEEDTIPIANDWRLLTPPVGSGNINIIDFRKNSLVYKRTSEIKKFYVGVKYET